MLCKLATLFMLLPVLVRAAIPSLTGFHVIWSDDFEGPKGSPPNDGKWDVRTNTPNSNGEIQIYSDYASNGHLSGGGELYIIPLHKGTSNGNGYWTSARFHSKANWTPPNGKVMIVRAEIMVPNFTNSPAKFAGLWPAFWTRGVGNPWPTTGELDIFEPTNWLSNTNVGTAHFGNNDKEDKKMLQKGSTTYNAGAYNNWSVKIDKTSSDWKKQRISWHLNGVQYAVITGTDAGSAHYWGQLANNPMYIILNVAVGGPHAGNPTDATLDGMAAAMRIKHVAVYHSN